MEPDVTIITTIHNGERFLFCWLDSILKTNFSGRPLEVSIFDDASTDNTKSILESAVIPCLQQSQVQVKFTSNDSAAPKGVGFGKNAAIRNSTGKFLCFADVDDVFHPERISLQYEAAKERNPLTLIGSRFTRDPLHSTKRFTAWANGLTTCQLKLQAFLSHGPTLIAPTWFCSRKLYEAVGGFEETEKRYPEDLKFFYDALRIGAELHRVERELVVYRLHDACASFSVSEHTIFKLRTQELEQCILSNWDSFTIWNAGKQGRLLLKALSRSSQLKVVSFCDVDARKILQGYYMLNSPDNLKIPIVHFSIAKPPFVICVKLGLTNGAFESNLNSLNLTEGIDYIHFN